MTILPFGKQLVSRRWKIQIQTIYYQRNYSKVMTVAKNSSQLKWIKLIVAIGLLSIFQMPAQSMQQMQSSPGQAQPGLPNKPEINLDVNMGSSNAQTSTSIGGGQQQGEFDFY